MGAIATLPVVGASVGEAAFVDGYGMVELGGGVAIRLSLPMMNLPVGNNVVMALPGYRLLLKRHSVRPETALMVEDIARNLAPAAELGMTTAWLRNRVDWAMEEAESEYELQEPIRGHW